MANYSKHLLRNPLRSAGRFNCQAKRYEGCQQKYRLPANCLIGLFNIKNTGENHTHSASKQGYGQADVGKQHHEQGDRKENSSLPYLIGP